MLNKSLRMISVLLLIVFPAVSILGQDFSFAAQTGTLKIFSETKGIKVYIDEELKGTDVIEVTGLTPGDHYVKITKDENVLYSELVKVSAGVTSAILIKSNVSAPAQPPAEVQQAADKLYKQAQEYKQNKLDIILSKSYQTVGSSYSDSMYFPGYYLWSGSEWTTSKSTQTEITDWKIIKGGVQQINDGEFANLVGDKDTLNRIQKDWEDYNNTAMWGAIIGLTGVVCLLVGMAALFSTETMTEQQTSSNAVIFSVGVLGTVIGLGMLSKEPHSGHYVSPSTAAKQAFDYNQALKKKLGLPESYEPR